ncbi:MAG: cation:dicarboxylate symporter family transporter [Neisseriaceae bacterium]
MQQTPWYFKLWLWVLIFMFAGIIFGIFFPILAKNTKPIIDSFIHLIRILVGPIIFFTVLSGIIGMGNLKQLGSIGLKTFIYFETISTIGLLLGLLIGHLFNPGGGLNLTISTLDPSLISQYTEHSQQATGFLKILSTVIPTNPIEPFIRGNTLQILFIAIILGFILFYTTKPWQHKLIFSLHKIQNFFFKILSYIMWLSPFAAFSAMAFMIGEFGIDILLHMLALIITMIMSCIFFILVVLGIIAKIAGFSIFKFLNYIKDEIILVFATSSSESALGPIMNKLTKSGIDDSVVGIVIPAGYSFNLDGTNIYLTLVIAFLCQAFNIHLTWQEHLIIILILMLTSKGAAGVTGAGFIVLAGTLAAMHGKIPVVTIVILLGIDKIMSELRSTTNLIGNSVATVVIAKMEKKINQKQFDKALYEQ